MNWDWEKLQNQRKRPSGPQGGGPDIGDINEQLRKLKRFRFPGGGKLIILAFLALWLASGIYIVEPDEVGVVKRFGAFDRITTSGPHYHIPYPVESVQTPRVTEIRRVEIGFRSSSARDTFQQGQFRIVPDESLMLTGDENILDVQFIVQYQIKDATHYLFKVNQQAETVKNAAEAAMREVIGNNKIDTALTTGKLEIQNQTQELMQDILDRYDIGIRVVNVQMQDVHPPAEVRDAFKDVASAREDKSRFINEAEAYRNDLLPRTRGQAAAITNDAQAYKESTILRARGGAERFVEVYDEYVKAKDVTRKRMYLETMERILSKADADKLVISDEAAGKVVPYLPLDQMRRERKEAQ